MLEGNICQFYIIVGDKEFTPLNKKDVYINATGVNDFNLINMAISREYRKKMEMKNPVTVSNKIIFLVPSNEYDSTCIKIVNELGIMYYEIKTISKYMAKGVNAPKLGAVKQVESGLKDNRNVTASGSENIEVQSGSSIKKITISDNKAYENIGMLSIDEQKYALLQEWKKDPYMWSKLVGLSSEEIDKMLMESVTMNLTTHRMESPREQNANDRASEVARDKAVKEEGLYNPELRIVRNNVSNSNPYSTVEVSNGKLQVVDPKVSSSTINFSGISNNYDAREIESHITSYDMQTRENLGEYYLDEEYNIYDNNGTVIGKVGQNGVWVEFNTNTLIMNGNVVGYVGDFKDMGKTSSSLNKNNVRVRKKEEGKSAAFVSLPVVMFVLSAMLLIGSIILLFVLD